MKKILVFTLICASLFALVSCADIDATASESTNTTSVQTTAPVQEFSEKKEYYENGNLKAITVYDKDGEMISVTEFNENKYVQIKKTVYQNGKILYISEYDENGALKEKTEFDENGNKTSHTAYSDYNEINLPSHIENTDIESGTKTVTKYKKDGKTLTETLIYNQAGLLTALQKYDSSGNPSDKNIYYYDENGLNIRMEELSSSGNLRYYALIDYYPSGKTRSASSYYSDGTNHYRIDYYETGEDWKEYIYHPQGFLSRIIEYSQSGNTIRSQDYENGILRVDTFFKDSASVIYEKVTLYNEDGSLNEYTIYEESQTITYYPDGTPKQLVELDQNGKTKKSTNYKPDGSVKTYTIGNISYYPNGNKYSVTEYDTHYGRAIKYYTIDGEYDGCTIYQDIGNWMSITKYDAEGNIISVDGYSTVSPG